MKNSDVPHDRDRPAIPVFDAAPGYRTLQAELDAAYQRVMAGGTYIFGAELEAFEAEFARACGASFCLGVANGLEALQLALLGFGVGPGDEVIVPAHTFIATWLAVSHCGARPVPVDVSESTFNIDASLISGAITPRTRAIVVVHLYGQPVDMHGILAIAEQYGLPVIEDASQAHGATYGGQRVGGLGAAAAFSFYPTKNLGAFGDGGAVVSSDASLIERVAGLRNYGSRTKYEHTVRGHNSRLDPLQAAFLRVKLGWLDRWNTRRREVAAAYTAGLRGCAAYRLPVVTNDVAHVWHQYVVRHPHRDSLREALAERGIGTALHYPIPPHRAPAYAGLGITDQMLPVTERLSGTVLSLPMGPYLTDDEVARVIDAARDCG